MSLHADVNLAIARQIFAPRLPTPKQITAGTGITLTELAGFTQIDASGGSADSDGTVITGRVFERQRDPLAGLLYVPPLQLGLASDSVYGSDRIYTNDGQFGKFLLNVQSFTANGTWTKPPGAFLVAVLMISGGGAGGSGRIGLAATLRGGGGGGGGSAAEFRIWPAGLFTATASVTVGAGGVGVTNVTNSGNGTVGGNGGSTTFNSVTPSAGGGGGAGTNAAGGAAGTAGAQNGTTSIQNLTWTAAGGAGAAGSSGAADAAAGATAAGFAAGGGGGGGGVSVGNVERQGGLGGTAGITPDIIGYFDNTFGPYMKSVRVATTATGTLATSFESGDTIDGVVLNKGDRILIKDQNNNTENGIYMVNASGAPTRAADDPTTGERGGQIVIREGTTNANTVWGVVRRTTGIGANRMFRQGATVRGGTGGGGDKGYSTADSLSLSSVGGRHGGGGGGGGGSTNGSGGQGSVPGDGGVGAVVVVTLSAHSSA